MHFLLKKGDEMKIELFMENPTDSFFQPVNADHVTTRLGAKTAYKPTKDHSFMNNKIDGRLGLPDGQVEVKVSVRKEDNLGFLLLNRISGRVYCLDSQAYNVLEQLMTGKTPSAVSQDLALTEESVYDVVDILRD